MDFGEVVCGSGFHGALEDNHSVVFVLFEVHQGLPDGRFVIFPLDFVVQSGQTQKYDGGAQTFLETSNSSVLETIVSWKEKKDLTLKDWNVFEMILEHGGLLKVYQK